MRSYRYLHLDVFTDHLFGGNQLAVVLDGRGLTAEIMQKIATEMSFSETTFVLPADRPDTDMRVRIFTPGEELPMAGHPTIGTAFALARAGVLDAGREGVVVGLGVGPTRVDLIWEGDDLGFAWMQQRPPSFGPPLACRREAAVALRLEERAIAALPIQVVSCGVPYLLVPLARRSDVDSASLDPVAFAALLAAAHLDNDLPVFVFTRERGADGAVAYCRMFAPGLGIREDPATGSAAGPLGSYLVHHECVPEAAGVMLARQGVAMGRPSDMHVAITASAGRVTGVRVGGRAVLAGEGTLYV